MLAGIELEKGRKPLLVAGREKLSYFVMRESLKRGVYLRPLGNLLMVIPPLAIEKKNLERVMDMHGEMLKLLEKLVSH
jgi:adenosylmethionine-8-amino-7-oxononanoate aminotransferase